MHLVGFGFEPGKEPLDAVPDIPGPLSFTFDHPPATLGPELAPGRIERNAALLRKLLEILLALCIGLRLPGLDDAAAQRLALIRNDESVIDADRAPEPAAGLARAHRRIEGKQARVRRLVG